MKSLKKDRVFSKKLPSIKKFVFNEDVAKVFDDMLTRSIPFYNEIHKIILDIIDRHYKGGIIYDLGCSTGTTISLIDKRCHKKNLPAPHFMGIDNSQSMLERCEKKLKRNKVRSFELSDQKIEEVSFQKSSMVIMNYTLQFIAPNKRPKLLKSIYSSLKKGGVFILSEKIKSSNKTINDMLIELYYDFKRRNGYSELEISQKREALENVLRPMTPEKQIEQLKAAGFTKVELIFRWYNFACYIGVK